MVKYNTSRLLRRGCHLKKARTYIRRHHVDLNGFVIGYEELEETNIDAEIICKIVEDGTVQARHALLLLNVRP